MSIDITDTADHSWSRSINLANGNFFHIWSEVLDLPYDHCGETDPGPVLEAAERVLAAINYQGRGSEFVRPESRVGNVLWCDVDVAYVRQRVREIQSIARRALRLGERVRWG